MLVDINHKLAVRLANRMTPKLPRGKHRMRSSVDVRDPSAVSSIAQMLRLLTNNNLSSEANEKVYAKMYRTLRSLSDVHSTTLPWIDFRDVVNDILALSRTAGAKYDTEEKCLMIPVPRMVLEDEEGEDGDIDVGPLEMRIPALSEGGITIRPTEGAPKSGDDLYFHPHVQPNGHPCLGEGGKEAAFQMACGNLYAGVMVLLSTLSEYDGSDCYCTIGQWRYNPVPCHVCDHEYPEDDLYECHCGCGELICTDCRVPVLSAGDELNVCEKHAIYCHTCENHHLESDVTDCSNCGHPSCELSTCSVHGCMNGLCKDCQTLCEECGMPTDWCDDHSPRCKDCGDLVYFCSSHAPACHVCGGELCHACYNAVAPCDPPHHGLCMSCLESMEGAEPQPEGELSCESI